jgi:hypothetical protein
VFLVDVADRENPKVRRVTQWNIDQDFEAEVAFLDFSPDGKQLLVSFLKKDGSISYRVNVDGKQPPKQVLADVEGTAWYTHFAPDGKGILCLITREGVELGQNTTVFCVIDADGARPRRLASFPGDVLEICPVWHWLGDKRLRLYLLTGDGITLVETDLDGTNRVEKRLSHDALKRQQELADLAFRLRSARAMPAGEEREKALHEIADALHDSANLDKTLEAEWDKVDNWEEAK